MDGKVKASTPLGIRKLEEIEMEKKTSQIGHCIHRLTIPPQTYLSQSEGTEGSSQHHMARSTSVGPK